MGVRGNKTLFPPCKVSLQHIIVILGSFTYFTELFPAASIDFLSMVHVKVLKIANGSIWGDWLS